MPAPIFGNSTLRHGTFGRMALVPPDSKFSHYLPSVDVAFGLLAWMPFPAAAVVWFAIMIAAWLWLLAAVHRDLLYDYDPTQARRSILVAGLLVMALIL